MKLTCHQYDDISSCISYAGIVRVWLPHEAFYGAKQ